MSGHWDEQNAEPSLDEILEDPIVRLLMQGDNTGEGEVRQLIERVRSSLGHAIVGDATAETPARKTRSKGTTRAA